MLSKNHTEGQFSGFFYQRASLGGAWPACQLLPPSPDAAQPQPSPVSQTDRTNALGSLLLEMQT